MSHTITITKLPDDVDDDIHYKIGGTCDGRCEFYRPCTKLWHRHPKNEWGDMDDEWGNSRVGPHMWLEGEWMKVAEGECAVQFADCIGEHAEDNGQLGTFALALEWDGDSWHGEPVGEPIPEPTGSDPYDDFCPTCDAPDQTHAPTCAVGHTSKDSTKERDRG